MQSVLYTAIDVSVKNGSQIFGKFVIMWSFMQLTLVLLYTLLHISWVFDFCKNVRLL